MKKTIFRHQLIPDNQLTSIKGGTILLKICSGRGDSPDGSTPPPPPPPK
ncbi:MAG: hypothetical protein AAFV95_17465 [Bacteroidota bacterium]